MHPRENWCSDIGSGEKCNRPTTYQLRDDISEVFVALLDGAAVGCLEVVQREWRGGGG